MAAPADLPITASSCPRCGRGKHRWQFACRSCWNALPRGNRDEINAAYRDDGPFSDAWLIAAALAFDAWGMERPRWLTAAMEDS